MTSQPQPAAERVSGRKTVPVELVGVGYAVPESVLSNADLEQLMETTDEWIFTRTGIRERRILKEPQTLTSLCVPAARSAIAQAGLTPADLDLIIVATSSPDHPMPSTAALLQAELGSCKAAAFDLAAACSGYVYGLATGAQFIQTGMYRHVLVVGADMLSRYMDYTDRGTSILFGDGAGATVLSAGTSEGFLSAVLAADGGGACHLDIAPNLDEPEPPARMQRRSYMRMNGREIYKFVADVVPRAIAEASAKAELPLEAVDHFILHQANMRILEAVAKRLGVPEAKMLHNISRYGNTSAASIPLVLGEAVESGVVKPGQTLCLVGFGSGLTWAASLVKWTGGPTA